jgi:hypothetical protein
LIGLPSLHGPFTPPQKIITSIATWCKPLPSLTRLAAADDLSSHLASLRCCFCRWLLVLRLQLW